MDLRFHHAHVGITLAAGHLQSTVDWYQEMLDFTVLDQFGVGPSTFTFLGNGEVKVELVSAGAQPAPSAAAQTLPASHDVERLHHICLAVTELDATVGELAKRGTPVFAGPVQVDRLGQRIAFVRDPVGTIIELTQPVPAPS